MTKLINHTYTKILEVIRTQPHLNLRGVIEQTRLSPNVTSACVNNLVKKNVLIENRLQKKRVYMRQFMLNHRSPLAQALFLLVEEEKKCVFYQKHPRLNAIAEQIISAFPKISSLVLYGSYAKDVETKDSDLDMLIIGSLKNKERLQEIFVTLETEPSIKIESPAQFKFKQHDPLHQEILKHHVVLYDVKIFMKQMLANAR